MFIYVFTFVYMCDTDIYKYIIVNVFDILILPRLYCVSYLAPPATSTNLTVLKGFMVLRTICLINKR